MKAMQKVIGSLIVGCVLACWLISNTNAQLIPPGGGGGTNNYDPPTSTFTAPDYGTNLWVAPAGIASGNLVGIISNTIPDIYFELQSKSDLVQDTQWVSSGFGVYGSKLTNWTPFSVAAVSPTNNLFLRIRSWADSTGSGIPDWWWLQYFGSVGGDPFAFDSAGDGWTLWQKFQNGMNPNVFYTPPTPQGLTVSYNANNNTATLNWIPSPGPVTGYTLQRQDWSGVTTNLTLPPNATGFSCVEDDPANALYNLQANYNGGNSAWSSVALYDVAYPSVSLITGPSGYLYVVVNNTPSDLSALRFYRFSQQYFQNGSWFWPYGHGPNYPADLANGYFEIPASSITNGIAQIPASQAYAYGRYNFKVQTICSNGASTVSEWLGSPVAINAFVDGRVQLKQNLIFLLRAASDTGPFEVNGTLQPVNCVISGFYNSNLGFDPLRPFENNYFNRNFVLDPNNLYTTDNLSLFYVIGMPIGTYYGDFYDDYNSDLYLNNPTYSSGFSSCITTNNPVAPSSLLTTSQTRWILPMSYITFFGSGLSVGESNYFGLAFLSEAIPFYTNSQFVIQTYYPGDNPGTTGFYYEADQPGFQTVDYYFARPGVDPMPEQDASDYDWEPRPTLFSTTNTTPLMITSVGNPNFQVAGYAKLAVTNGYPGVYGYLGQYFDQAYTEDTNGVATTTPTGIRSPYGNFFATEPGPAALMTMPDVDTGARGTCTVYCVSIVLDKNHDGIMDTSFNGPDATSQASPMEFWVNSGNDKPGSGTNLDKDLPVPPNAPNYQYHEIRCQRNLENFARLWLCGMPPLPANQGYSVNLSLSPISGTNPAINLYLAADSAGGIGYLTNTDLAVQQVGVWNPLATLSGNASLTFADGTFAFGGNLSFLFEGAGTGEGQLTLTISQNGNTIAQTSAYLDLHDIKDFYERATITNNMSGAISNWSSTIEDVQPATANLLGNDTNLIVFVHGFNVGPWDWLDDSDTVFKRLYWAGYHGKFMTVKWPAEPLTVWTGITENTSIFNNSEINAYKAGTALKNYLSQLRTRFPNYQLNVLAHSQGNAVMGEAIEQGAPFDTYILTQGAMPASSYDVNTLTDSTLLAAEALVHTPEWQPMGYHGVYTNMTGTIVSFFNTNDSVLNVWIADQSAGKPNGYANHLLTPLAPYYSYDGDDGWWNGILYGLFSSYLVTDPQESRAMISRSRTQAVGRQDTGGVINSTIDLAAKFGFTTGTAEHSAEWTRPIQTSLPYYKQVLLQIQPSP